MRQLLALLYRGTVLPLLVFTKIKTINQVVIEIGVLLPIMSSLLYTITNSRIIEQFTENLDLSKAVFVFFYRTSICLPYISLKMNVLI